MPDATPVDTPIVVFISSHQKEFQEIRFTLKDTIDGEDFFKKLIMKGELVERRSGERIRGDITAAMRRSTIYLGIFGNHYSKVVREEYEEARRRGLPMVVFDVLSPKSSKEKREPKVKTFLERQVMGLDDVRVTTIRANSSKPAEMLETIIQRLANAVVELANQNLEIRKIVNPQ